MFSRQLRRSLGRYRGGHQDLFLNYTPPISLPEIVRGSGIRLFDSQGNSYIDASSGPCAVNLGHGNEYVAAAMKKQAEKVTFAYPRVARYAPTERFAMRLNDAIFDKSFGKSSSDSDSINPSDSKNSKNSEISNNNNQDHVHDLDPKKSENYASDIDMYRMFFATSGSEANDHAMSFSRMLALSRGEPERSVVISLAPSYHGATLQCLSIVGDPNLQGFLSHGFGPTTRRIKVNSPFVHKIEAERRGEDVKSDTSTFLEDAERELIAAFESQKEGTVLALVMEPIGGLASGAYSIPESYIQLARRLCDKHGANLVFDEVLCGAGRSGESFFAATRDATPLPDILVSGKGLASGYAPVSSCAIRSDYVDELARKGGYSLLHTYSSHPISIAAANAVFDIIENENLVDRSKAVGKRLRRGLAEAVSGSPAVKDIRGEGSLLAVEFNVGNDNNSSSSNDDDGKDKKKNELVMCDAARVYGLEEGLILYSRMTAGGRYGQWVMMTPPLNTTDDEIDEIVERFSKVVAKMEHLVE